MITKSKSTGKKITIDDLKQLILLSISLKQSEKDYLINLIPTLDKWTLSKMYKLFKQDLEAKNKILKDEFIKSPNKAQDYEEKIRKIVNHSFTQSEKIEQELEDPNNILQKLV